MKVIQCLNFCGILEHLIRKEPDMERMIKSLCDKYTKEQVRRIYIGSSFCSHYVLRMQLNHLLELKKVCIQNEIPMTLVLPIFSEELLEPGKHKIAMILSQLEQVVDEVTVNDYGMLAYIHQTYKKNMNLGRLFMKDYRDPRYEEYFSQTLFPKIFTSYFYQLILEYQIRGLEFDKTHESIQFPREERWEGLTIAMHTPYCYMTTGQICEYGSIGKELSHKFRPGRDCKGECSSHLIHYNLGDERTWLRVGRTIFFSNPECKIIGLDTMRELYFPVSMEVFE